MSTQAIPDDLPVSELSRTHAPAGEFPNKHVPGAKEYYPLTEPPIGTALPAVCLLPDLA